MSSFVYSEIPATVRAEIIWQLKQREARIEYDTQRDGPVDIALALKLADALKAKDVKKWCSKDFPEAAEFAKAYLDTMQGKNGYWHSPFKSVFRFASGSDGVGPVAPIRQYVSAGVAVSRAAAEASQSRPVASTQQPQTHAKQPASTLREMPILTPQATTATTVLPNPTDTMTKAELRGKIVKDLWTIVRMIKFAVSPKIFKFLWHLQKRDAELSMKELEEIIAELKKLLKDSQGKDEPDPLLDGMLNHLDETVKDISQTIQKTQKGETITCTTSNSAVRPTPVTAVAKTKEGSSPTTATETTSDPSPGLYHELPTPSSIRLLEVIAVDSTETLQGRLHVVDLEDAPKYTAFSYVWADPRIALYRKSKVKDPERKHNLICNDGKVIQITENLHNALRALFPLNGHLDNTNSLTIDCGWLWIDQLCINQAKNKEKSAQVAMMGRIYRSAQSVLSWLGPADRHTDEAKQVIVSLSAIPKEIYSAPSYDPTIQVNKFGSSPWISTVVLLSLPYFQRAWIVQELAFAKQNTMVWGHQVFQWKDIIHAARYLTSTNAWTLLRKEVAAFNPLWEKQLESPSSHQPLSSAIDLHMEIKHLANTSQDVDAPYRLFMSGRLLQATNPKDKFFAMLDLAKMSAQRVQTSFPDLKPDYDKTIEDITKEFSSKLVELKGDLSILTHVEDRSFRKLPKLPSWMPDYTAPLIPRNLTAGLRKEWNAGGGAEYGFKVVAANAVLMVHGHRVDDINSVAMPFNENLDSGDWRSVLLLTKSLYEVDDPHIEQSPDTRLLSALLCSTSVLEADSEKRAQLKAEFSAWIIHKLLAIKSKSNYNPDAAMLLISREFEEIMSHVRDPLSKGSRMPSMTSSEDTRKMMFSGPQTKTLRAEDVTHLLDTTAAAMLELWNLNRDGFFPDSQQIRRTLQVFEGSTKPQGTEEERKREKADVKDKVSKFDMAVGSNLDGRVLFRSGSGYLGLAPQSTQAGQDEIWVLGHLSVPVVLRPWPPKGNNGAYQLVGHCYLPSVMKANGERQGESYFQPIYLV